MPLTESMILGETFSYEEACAYIDDAAKLGSKPGLARIGALCEELGHPEDELRFIHVAGTNGKGSTAAMIASALSSGGIRTGMYYSPALTGIRDHYTVNGVLISEDDYARCVSEAAAANEKLSDPATQFELETAVAFVFFRKMHCDAVVLECGMGGTYDATHIVKNKICCVITSVSFDHMQYLGSTLGEIASAKAGIITSSCPVITAYSSDEITDVIKKRCDMTGSTCHVVMPPYPDIRTGLLGTFQTENAAVAYTAVNAIRDGGLIPGFTLSDEKIREGIARTKWPFRFERICDLPPVYVDGAHNEKAAIRLKETIEQYLKGYKIILVIGVFADKEYEKLVSILVPCAHEVFTVKTPGNPRALSEKTLAQCAAKFCGSVTACASLSDAAALSLKAAEHAGRNGTEAAVLACGSLSYLNGFAKEIRDKTNTL